MGFNTLNTVNRLSTTTLKLISEAGRAKDQHVAIVPAGASNLNSMIRLISDSQEEPEPFYILDLGVVARLMEKWNQCLPNVKPFYAVKCNYEPALLAALAILGANFDCASQAEIETILGLGVSPDRIVYANPCKFASHIKYAASVGVNLTTFDSKEEVDKIKKWHPKCGLLLRIRVPNDNTSWRSLGGKYGASPEEVVPLLQHAKDSGLRVLGVSFHVGSKASDAQVYRGAIKAARFAFDAAAKLKMYPMHILNIGGGFKDNSLFDEIGKTVNDSIHEYFPNEQSLTLMAEPGRYMVETAFTLVTNVIGKRVRKDQIQYWIDDGMYGSFHISVFDRSCMMFKPLMRNGDGEGEGAGAVTSSTIFGPTCDSLDIVANECKMPELQVDDLLVFYNMGAYTTAPASKFNGLKRFDMPAYLVYSGAN